MANITLRGVITMIGESQVFGNFEKRIFWIEEQNVQYPNSWQLECQQNDCNILDNFKIGQEVDCSINIRGRYWEKTEEGRSGVINTLRCWKITTIGQQQPQQPQGQYRQQQQSALEQYAEPKKNATQQTELENNKNDDDLPF